MSRKATRAGKLITRTATGAISVALAAGLLLSAAGCTKTLSPGQAASKKAASQQAAKAHKLPVSGPVEPLADGVLCGVFEPDAPFVMSDLERYESLTGERPALLMWFQQWSKTTRWEFDRAACVASLRRGSIPLITWEPRDPNTDNAQADFPLKDIVAGKYDAYIRTWARGVRDVGGPVMIRPMHEMNGTWYEWGGPAPGNSPMLFKQAWWHIHDIFRSEGVKNVTWVWSINARSVPNTKANHYDLYYPGDDYVDWTGISGFNRGTTRETSDWRTFDEVYRGALAYLETVDKPILISELGSVEQGGDKAAWIADAFERIETEHPKVKGIIYFDDVDGPNNGFRDWRIDSSPESADAFRAAMSSPYFEGGPAPTLSAWGDRLEVIDWHKLQAYTPVY